MPVHKISKNGQTFYQWGSEGKLYKTKQEAEAQGRAAYASGYKSQEMKSNNGKL